MLELGRHVDDRGPHHPGGRPTVCGWRSSSAPPTGGTSRLSSTRAAPALVDMTQAAFTGPSDRAAAGARGQKYARCRSRWQVRRGGQRSLERSCAGTGGVRPSRRPVSFLSSAQPPHAAGLRVGTHSTVPAERAVRVCSTTGARLARLRSSFGCRCTTASRYSSSGRSKPSSVCHLCRGR
jgi:hypothetical protein